MFGYDRPEIVGKSGIAIEQIDRAADADTLFVGPPFRA